MDLSRLTSPIILAGDERTAYRDPALLYNDGVLFLFFTWVEIEADGRIFSYTGFSTSPDLITWTPPRKLTPRDQSLNYSSPGNVIRFKNEWVLCLQTYPRPGYRVEQIPRFGDTTSRIYLMRSADLEHWSSPEIARVKGPDVPVEAMGRMIDPYLLEDKDEPGLWWCFYKQNGVSMSCSHDLQTWTYRGSVPSGENVCVIVEDDEYILFHSPSDGIAVKRSGDLEHWRDWGSLIRLGQDDWPWAKGRITAGTVANLNDVPGVGAYLMIFHGSGPETERVHFDSHASLGIAWSYDLRHWSWPGKLRDGNTP